MAEDRKIIEIGNSTITDDTQKKRHVHNLTMVIIYSV